MIRAFRAVVAIAGLLGGIGFLRAGLWFLREAGGAGKVSEGELAGSVATGDIRAIGLAREPRRLGLVLGFDGVGQDGIGHVEFATEYLASRSRGRPFDWE